MTSDPASARSAQMLHSRMPFVGRGAELATLLERAAETPSTIVVTGTAGIGKTRLLTELTDRAEQTVLYGRGWRGGETTPYVPWTQILSAARELLGPGEISRFRDLAPLMSGRSQQPRFAHSDSMQHVLGLALGEYLREVARICDNNLLVVVDDLHHADTPSIALALAISRQRLPIALLTTSRPLDETQREHADLLESLLSEADVLALHPLDRSDIEQILTAEGISPDLAEVAEAATEGFPLLLDHWVRSSAGAGANPKESAIARVKELGADTESLLRLAALSGDVFDLSVIATALDVSFPTALGHLEQAATAGLVMSDGQSFTRFRFAHETIREALNDSSSVSERATGHGRLLDILLERRGTAGEVDVSILAGHASEAAVLGNAPLAIELTIEAADAALRRAAPEAAITQFQRAIELAGFAGGSRRDRLIAEIGIGRAHKMADDPAARGVLLGVLESVEDDDENTDLGIEAALLLPTSVGAMGIGADRDAVLVRWLEWAIDAVGYEPTVVRGRLLLELGIQTYARSAPQGELLVVEAAETAERCGDGALLAQAVCHRHWFRRFPGDMAEVLAEVDRLEQGVRATDADARLSLSGLRIATLLRAGRFTEALAEVHSLEVELSPLPPSAQWTIGRWRATIHLVRGDHRAAEAEALAAFALVEKSPFGIIAIDYLSLLLASVMSARMQHDQIAELTATMVESPSPMLAIPAKAGAAMVLAELGRDAEARELLRQVPRAVLEYRDPHELAWLTGVTLLSQAGVALNDAEKAAEFLDALEPYRHEWIVWGSGFMCFGPVALRRGQAALVAGRVDIAKADLDVARREIIDSGARMFEPPLLHAESELALLAGDRAGAVAAMSEASTLCADLDLEVAAAMFAARAIDLSESPGPRPQPTGRNLTRHGAVWTICFDESPVSVGHVKGLVALELLLTNPHRRFHALELASVIDGVTAGLSGESTSVRQESADPVLDSRALGEYRSRISELEAEIDEASAFNDTERESIARLEMDSILEELKLATGLSGRSRDLPSNAERARVRITKSIRAAINRIEAVDTRAGYYLSNSIRTGASCVYEPAQGDPPWNG